MKNKSVGKALAGFGLLFALAHSASAGYLDPVLTFGMALILVMKNIGNALAVVFFLYGGAKYVYTADDPGGRKQGMGICVAAIIAFIIIQVGERLVCAIPITGMTGPAGPWC